MHLNIALIHTESSFLKKRFCNKYCDPRNADDFQFKLEYNVSALLTAIHALLKTSSLIGRLCSTLPIKVPRIRWRWCKFRKSSTTQFVVLLFRNLYHFCQILESIAQVSYLVLPSHCASDALRRITKIRTIVFDLQSRIIRIKKTYCFNLTRNERWSNMYYMKIMPNTSNYVSGGINRFEIL